MIDAVSYTETEALDLGIIDIVAADIPELISKLDGMIERQAVELDPVRRRAQLMAIQTRVLDQAYLFSPVTGASRWVFNRDVRGFQPNTALSEYLYWARVWLDR